MARRLSHVGGARLERGDFQVYVGQGQRRTYMEEGPLKEHIKEYWHFLMGGFESAKIGPREVRKGLSKNNLPVTSFQWLAGRILLYKKGEGFATFVWELPFPEFGTPEAETTEEGHEVEEEYVEEGYGDS